MGRLCPMFLWCGMAMLLTDVYILILWDMPTYFIDHPWFPFCSWCYQNSYPQSNPLWCLLVYSTYIERSKICPFCRFFKLHYFSIIIIFWWVLFFPLQWIVWCLKEETNRCVWLLYPQPWKGEGGWDYLEWGVELNFLVSSCYGSPGQMDEHWIKKMNR